MNEPFKFCPHCGHALAPIPYSPVTPILPWGPGIPMPTTPISPWMPPANKTPIVCKTS